MRSLSFYAAGDYNERSGGEENWESEGGGETHGRSGMTTEEDPQRKRKQQEGQVQTRVDFIKRNIEVGIY